jgi:hypothetical protein
MSKIAIINESTLVTNDQVIAMVSAIQIQLNEHVLPAWNMKTCEVKFYANKAAAPGSSWIVDILDDSTQAGALGYHSLDNDRVDAFIFASPVLSNGGAVLVFDPNNPTQYTVSATLSHEVCEMIGDRYANSFCLGPQLSGGNLFCQELCDPVEALSYGINVGGVQVSVSNFVFPSFFNPEAVSPQNLPFDYLNQLSTPFSMAVGGYQIIATLTNEGQITSDQGQVSAKLSTKLVFGAKMPQWRRDYVMGAYYRGYQRNSAGRSLRRGSRN